MSSPESPCSITAVRDASEPGCDLVRQWLREHNEAANPKFMAQLAQPAHRARPLVLLAEDESGVAGGLFAETQQHWLRIAIEAVKRGCRHAYLDTMDYQAPRFYLTHGFEIAGRIADWDSHGHEKLSLTKRLLGR